MIRLEMTSTLAIAFAAVSSWTSSAAALPIRVDGDGSPAETFHLRELIGMNNVGLRPSPTSAGILLFGAANLYPNGSEGTSGSATQAGVTRPLSFVPQTVSPGLFAAGVGYDPALTGVWTLTFFNGEDSLVVETPTVGEIDLPDRITGLAAKADPTSLQFAWETPANADEVSIFIYDRDDRDPASGLANRIFADAVSPDAGVYDVPLALLRPGGAYTVSFDTVVAHGPEAGSNPTGSSREGAPRSRARTFFDFVAGSLDEGDGVLLPVVEIVDGAPVFRFDNAVLEGDVRLYDPLVAVGYDFIIGDGDPNFRSVLPPDLGDGLFDLWLADGDGWAFETEISGGVEHLFAAGGESRFRLLGIEPGLGLDPLDGTAFVTGLSFVADGRFTGTMTPITAASDARVPLPPAGALLALGAMALAGAVWRGRGV